ncbi:hypothetical protein [Pseudarthrobacter siccitolerans]
MSNFPDYFETNQKTLSGAIEVGAEASLARAAVLAQRIKTTNWIT